MPTSPTPVLPAPSGAGSVGELTARLEGVLEVVRSGRGEAVGAVVDPAVVAGGWVGLLATVRAIGSAAEAVELVALARLAGTDEEVTSEGELVEVDRGVGHVRLDASDLVAAALGVTPRHAQDRVDDAVRVATHLPGVGDWLAQGRVTGYGIRTLVEATQDLDADQCARVVKALAPWVADVSGRRGGRVLTGSALRARARAVIAQVAPETLVDAAAKVTGDRCLTRDHDRIGGQYWTAVLPDGEADLAWETVDTCARQMVRDGLAATLEHARADALVQLVLRNVTTKITINLATPALPAAPGQATAPSTAATATATAATVVPVTGFGPGVVEVTSEWLTGLASRPGTRIVQLALDPETGALVDPPPGTTVHDPPAALARWIVARDGTCRFPDCDVRASRCDLDHVIPWQDPTEHPGTPGLTEASNLIALCRHHHRVKQRPGWTLTLHPDGRADWTSPAGHTTTTTPVDHRNPGTRPPGPEEPGSDTPERHAYSALEAHYCATLRTCHRRHRRTDLRLARELRHRLPLTDSHDRTAHGTPVALIRHWRQTTTRITLAELRALAHPDGHPHHNPTPDNPTPDNPYDGPPPF